MLTMTSDAAFLLRSISRFPASNTSADTAVRKGSPLLVCGHTSTPAIPSASPRYGSTLPILAIRTSSETCSAAAEALANTWARLSQAR